MQLNKLEEYVNLRFNVKLIKKYFEKPINKLYLNQI